MYEEQLLETTIALSPAALLVYLSLAGIIGWALRAVLKKTWMHRFWEHGSPHTYPQRNHTYVEYVPEVPQYTHYHSEIPETLPFATSETSYDLTVIQGIDMRIQNILNTAGIMTTEDLSDTSADELRDILAHAGVTPDPTTWPHQAYLAWHEQWSELKRYQDLLNGKVL